MAAFERTKCGSFVLFKPSEEQRRAGMKSEQIQMYLFKKMETEFHKNRGYRKYINELETDVKKYVLKEYYRMMRNEHVGNQMVSPAPRLVPQERAVSVCSPVRICRLSFGMPCNCVNNIFCRNRNKSPIEETPVEETPRPQTPHFEAPLDEPCTPRSARLRNRRNRDIETPVSDRSVSVTPAPRGRKRKAEADDSVDYTSMDYPKTPKFSTPLNKKRRLTEQEGTSNSFELLDLELSPIQANSSTSSSSSSINSPLGALDVPCFSEHFIDHPPALACVKSEHGGLPPGPHLSISKAEAREARKIRKKTDEKWASAFRAKIRQSNLLFEELGEKHGFWQLLDPKMPRQKNDLLRAEISVILKKWGKVFDRRGIDESKVESFVVARDKLKKRIGKEQARSALRIFPEQYSRKLSEAFDKFPRNYPMFFEETLTVNVASDVIKEFYDQAEENRLNQSTQEEDLVTNGSSLSNRDVSPGTLARLEEEKASRRMDESINFVAHPFGQSLERREDVQEELNVEENGSFSQEELALAENGEAAQEYQEANGDEVQEELDVEENGEFAYEDMIPLENGEAAQEENQNAADGDEAQEMNDEIVEVIDDIDDDIEIIEPPPRRVFVAPIIRLDPDMIPFGGYQQAELEQPPIDIDVLPPVRQIDRRFWHDDDEDDDDLQIVEEPEVQIIPPAANNEVADPDIQIIAIKEKEVIKLIIPKGATNNWSLWTAPQVHDWAVSVLRLHEDYYGSKDRKADLRLLHDVVGEQLHNIVQNRNWRGSQYAFDTIVKHLQKVIDAFNAQNR
ncbi:hypothetical protein CRE_25947 [Caenorhabditis remanei]|uniref:Uncharacterized protein n=1 Tax=Caenorhabditis remanei TaxID=31234 RepID=E3NKL1_CAERE|nr:hypothetical protein CRE_25947 [Caenorhabditis remanei]